MADPVRISNLFSSFDSTAVLSQLRAARETALTKLDTKSAVAASKKLALQAVGSKFTSLQTALQALTGAASMTSKTVTSSGTAVSATAGTNAPLGTFTVDVNQLATGTKVSGSVISAAPSMTAEIGKAGFAVTPTNGTYTVGTAGGGLRQLSIGGESVQAGAPLSASNFSTAVTAGNFTIATATGSAVITVDPATQTLNDVVTAINGAGVNVTATITNDSNGRANILTLTTTDPSITLTEGTSNFLTATNLKNATGTTTLSSTSAFTKQMSLNDVIADINGAPVGITASITNDANGRATIVTLTAATAISLGNIGDGSNFLSAANLLASPTGTTRASTAPVSRISLTDMLSSAAMLGGPPAAGAHTITINGTSIAYDTATDSLSAILARISSSAAGVNARYDPASDAISLQQTKTGSMAITLADDGAGGNLLSKLGLAAATQTMGVSASYQINGGAAAFSADNTVDLGNGVVLALATTTTVGSPVTVTVGQNTSSAVSQVRGFVTAFNDVMSTIASATKADGATASNTSGPLSGDASLRMLGQSLRSGVMSTAINPSGNIKSLSEIGLSFGAVGSALGSTNTLQFDQTKFQAALANDPNSVQSLLSAFTLNAALTPGGTSSIAGMTGTYTGGIPGTYTFTDDGIGNLKSVFAPASGAPATTQDVIISANGTNSSLVPGMTLTFGGVLTAGTSSVVVSATSQGVGQTLRRLVDVQVGTGGVLQSRQDTYTKSIADIARQHDRVQGQIDAEMEVWRKKFAAMETAQARLQQVQNSVTQMVNQMNANSSTKSG